MTESEPELTDEKIVSAGCTVPNYNYKINQLYIIRPKEEYTFANQAVATYNYNHCNVDSVVMHGGENE